MVLYKGAMESILVGCRLYLDGLCLELNNIKAECDICEVLLHHLMSADDICLFDLKPGGKRYETTWVAKRTAFVCFVHVYCKVCLMGVRFKQNRIKLFNCRKAVCMMFKAKTAKGTVILLLTLGLQRVKSVSHYKYLVIPLDIKLSGGKNIQRQLQYRHYAVNNLRSSFSRCSS